MGLPADFNTAANDPQNPEFLLAHALESFWKNGGKQARIISSGKYTSEGQNKTAAHFLQALAKVDLAKRNTIILSPDAILLNDGDYATVSRELLLKASQTGSFAILDLKYDFGESPSTAANRFRTQIAGPHLREGAVYWPYVKQSNSPWMGPSALIAGKIAALDQSQGVWKAPAGTEALFAESIEQNPSNGEIKVLQVHPAAGISINPLRTLPGKGILVWGSRTLAGNDNEWRYVPVRRLALQLEIEMDVIMKNYKNSPNISSTWNSIKSDARDVLNDLFRKGAFQGQTVSKAFFIKIGLRETMTQVDVNQGRMILELGFAPLKPAEFIILRIQNN
ncbi:MAG: hypothetical protein AAFR87_03980 [Bacteroidota bacterium]